MAHTDSGSSANGDHLSWIAAARREADALRHRSTFDGPGGGNAGRYVSEVDLRSVLTTELEGYELGGDVFRGGQGVVFRARQAGTRRDVAIKMLRESPLTGSSGVARFEREVQILSQLRHPNIVSVLETGKLRDNYYFVMDYVEGWSLDDYLFEKRPSPREILELFAKTCDAVNVAHLRGVIHRDLKPGNVRVDRAGEPHVMDFGLAKGNEHDDFGAAMTVTGQFVGSLPWASPEQVEATPEGIDIRTDVYSIGVMLYHALTGKFPYPVGESFRQTIDHICHTIPERPSAFREELDDEIDQIVLKCLKKERDLRYQSAGSITKDIRRYLAGEAIEAKRDSAWYVVRKAIRKHRVAATMIGMVLAMIVLSIGGLIYFYDREARLHKEADEQRAIAEAERSEAVEARDEALRQKRIADAVNEFFNGDLLASVAPNALGRDVTVREALDAASKTIDERFKDEPGIRAQIEFVMGNTYMRLGVLDKAERHLADARALFDEELGPDHEVSLMALNDVARVYEAEGKMDQAVAAFKECLERRIRVFGRDDESVMTSQSNLGWIYAKLGRYDEAGPLLLAAYEGRRKQFGDDDPQTQTMLNNVAMFYHVIGRNEKAAELSEKELAASRRLHPNDPSTFVSMVNVATIDMGLHKYKQAEALFNEALEGRKRVLGEAHPKTLLTMNNLATLYTKIDRTPDAEKLLSDALRLAIAEHGEDLPIVNSLRSNLGWIYNASGRYAEAEPLHAKAVAGARKQLPEDHATIGIFLKRHGDSLIGLKRYDEAEAALLEAYAIQSKLGESEAGNAVETAETLESLYETLGRAGDARKWRDNVEQAESADKPAESSVTKDRQGT